MTLTKAIEILTLHFKGHRLERDSDYFNALYLSIKALEEVKRNRICPPNGIFSLLPGETEGPQPPESSTPEKAVKP